MIGLAKKAGRVEIGEEPVGSAARSRHARVILVASDAAAGSVRRAYAFAQTGACLCLTIPADKDALGRALGRSMFPNVLPGACPHFLLLQDHLSPFCLPVVDKYSGHEDLSEALHDRPIYGCFLQAEPFRLLPYSRRLRQEFRWCFR